ncbi:DUF3574 domain-containing protein [Roseomonas sp. CECT 9278]|uniref:DUF3574 domain-containing protein n=1 Tax=Roseomonas sp. CECT 9278 TaxID=2845823 RepID=UPI001E3EF968|nr:DUF3574 domain-containing protein [Roseomonas sp. CECT 9278]CAH0136494.1 hypothetical protein ROS9278_00368 [Roseomonas sp. CECT 9278]
MGAEGARVAAAGLVALAAACAPPAPPCPEGTTQATVAEAYFGQSRRDGPAITEGEWRDFLAGTVTPAFPDGLTALDGRGQWRRPDGTILAEASKVLVVVMPGADAAAARARLRPVEEAWKARFRHQSVLTVYRAACVGF